MQQRTLLRNERGIAMAVAMLLLMTLSVLGASLMFLAQTESASSISYRLMTQARYGAESGIQSAANYLLNAYTLPGGPGDPLSNYDLTSSPVKSTINGNPIVLTSDPNVTSNYPAGAVQTAFSGAVHGTLLSASTNVQYVATATLLSMTPISTYGGVNTVVQTWQITGTGTVAGVHPATIQVTSTLEQQIVPAVSDAAFATGASCGALNFAGNEVIDSYDSTSMTFSGGNLVTQAYGGNVGTNGNLTLAGHATIDGSLSTPRTGVGTCQDGNVDALTESGQATVTGGIIQLPQTVVLATPAAPIPTPPTTSISFTKNSGCAGAGSCSSSGADITLTGGSSAAPLVLGDVNVSTQGVLHLTAGYYNFNSLEVGSQSAIVIDSGPVVLNVAGQNQSTPIDLSSGTTTNASLNPANFQVIYGGTGTVKLNGGAQTAMVVYAPNANAMFPSSNSTYYGSIIASTVAANGAQIHYDRHLSSEFFTAGAHMLTAFTWKKY